MTPQRSASSFKKPPGKRRPSTTLRGSSSGSRETSNPAPMPLQPNGVDGVLGSCGLAGAIGTQLCSAACSPPCSGCCAGCAHGDRATAVEPFDETADWAAACCGTRCVGANIGAAEATGAEASGVVAEDAVALHWTAGIATCSPTPAARLTGMIGDSPGCECGGCVATPAAGANLADLTASATEGMDEPTPSSEKSPILRRLWSAKSCSSVFTRVIADTTCCALPSRCAKNR
mmetsp:Transcript_39302/g.101926  ORF Transcript_39302/g.101926 Transcript_39302/m.101926 type:complete len:232 (-) Transcript_39302:453-1148(-)